jgi:hypothetical protein
LPHAPAGVVISAHHDAADCFLRDAYADRQPPAPPFIKMATPLSPDPFMLSSGMRTGDPPADAVMALEALNASTNAAIREARKHSDVMKPLPWDVRSVESM